MLENMILKVKYWLGQKFSVRKVYGNKTEKMEFSLIPCTLIGWHYTLCTNLNLAQKRPKILINNCLS